MTLQAPFPWFGGKSRVAPLVWERFGDVQNYVEPFFGTGAVLLARPNYDGQTETINDADGFVANAWRSIKLRPEETAEHADWPSNENDLTARHIWLVGKRAELTARLEGDPEYCDPKIAGWWIWGACCWIGSGWCSGSGPWGSVDGQLVHLGDAGRGVNRQLVHLRSAGMGVNRKLVHLGNWFSELSDRLRNVRVACGDWSRVCGPSPLMIRTVSSIGVFLDPPYSQDERADVYSCEMPSAVAVRDYAVETAREWSHVRVALCGYEGEHVMPEDWECVPWKTAGGYGTQGEGRGRENADRERIWFSPSCLGRRQRSLF
jgi:hypothetical protein